MIGRFQLFFLSSYTLFIHCDRWERATDSRSIKSSFSNYKYEELNIFHIYSINNNEKVCLSVTKVKVNAVRKSEREPQRHFVRKIPKGQRSRAEEAEVQVRLTRRAGRKASGRMFYLGFLSQF